MKFLLRLPAVGIVFFVLGCGFGPPKGMQPEPFLDFAEHASSDIVASFNDFSAFDIAQPYWLPNPLLWYFSVEDTIRFIKKPYPVRQGDDRLLFYLSENGEICLNRDFYFTMRDKGLVYSFDKKNWFATDGDPREYEAFVPEIRFESKRERQSLDFIFTWAVREGDTPKRIPSSDSLYLASRREVTLTPNTVCYSTDKNDDAVDLHRTVFFVPKGTSVRFRWDVTSNFLSLYQTDAVTTVLKPLRDLYFYRKNRIVSLGFDGKDYGDTFFSYRFAMKQSVVTDENGLPTACQKIVLINKKFPYSNPAANQSSPFR